MSKLPGLVILALAITISVSVSDSYAFDPQVFDMTLTDVQTQQYAGYDIITIDFNLFNNGAENVALSGHSQIYLNDTNADYWELINYQDFGFTSTDCPSLDVTAIANSTTSVKLCFLTTDEPDIGYSLVIENNDFTNPAQPKELVMESVPSWFTTTANAWCNDIIPDSEYLNSAQFNVQQGNIDVMRAQSGTDVGASIPAWVKTNACDWSNDLISDYEYLDGIYWLIDNGKIQV